MALPNLGTITTKQKMTGVKFQAQDAAGNPAVSFNGMTLSADQPSCVSFENQTVTPDASAGSTFTVDIVGVAASTGPVTITATGQQGNFQPAFTSQVQLTVIVDPSTPGVPTNWVVTPGTIVSQ